jgi:hypothetical protein
MKTYSKAFYESRHEKTTYSATTILSILLQRIPAVHSAVDVGCGVGTWLAALREKGVKDIQGLDGRWVDQDLLAIPRTCFKQVDLSQAAIELPHRYDLAISLEVAEHLPADRATYFVSSLTALSDYVLFSAATPFQGGVNHINEQWQHYWVELFGGLNYAVHDFIRPKIWNDKNIPFWYRQNILLFSNQEKANEARLDSTAADVWSMPLDIVHPDLYLSKINMRANVSMGVRSSFRLFRRSLGDYINRKLDR